MKSGLTIIELLIVIAIIGILAGSGVFIIGNKIKLTRDADRQTDIYEIRLGLEQYFIDHYRYPDSLAFNNEALKSDDGTKIYLPRVHHDIINKSPYIYTYNATPSGDASSYDLCATLEIDNSSFCLHQLQ